MSELTKVSPDTLSSTDVIFVHGLDGDGVATWATSKKLADSWPAWLEAEVRGLAAWSLSYEIKALQWRGNTMALPDRATNILELLISKGIGKRPLAFVCHSYGGLIVKQMLRSAAESNDGTKRTFVQNTRGILFLATPHAGSEKADWFVHFARILSPSAATAELEAHNAQLRDLALWYRNNAEKLGIETVAMFETKPTKGIHIVDATSADPGITGLVPIPIDADHITICKPGSKENEVFVHVVRYFRNWFSPDDSTIEPISAILTRVDWPSTSNISAEEVRKSMKNVAASAFPDGTVEFPKGSFLQSRETSIYFVVRKPSVALRAAIEFMQGWHSFTSKNYPDSRTIIGQGVVHDAHNWRLVDIDEALWSQLPSAGIYASEAVVDAVDPTMATFSLASQTGDAASRLFRVEFEDPRTVRDSSLIPAFFVAHPSAHSVRVRLVELFLIEYMLEKGTLGALFEFEAWRKQRSYPEVSPSLIEDILKSSEYFQHTQDGKDRRYQLREDSRKQIEEERGSYDRAQRDCVDVVRASLRELTGSEVAADLTDLHILIEEYLSAVFLEVRLMANYMRRTDQVFDSATQTLRKYDHIINRRLQGLSDTASEAWRAGFIRGLKRAAETRNTYVAAIFHNVLATYYLNRSRRAARYQRERLKGRTVYIDTNVLYAARVVASSYHEVSRYLVKNLKELGFELRVFPFSIQEYESSLRSVDRGFHDGVPDPWIVEINPWIYQEFKLNREAYLTFSACREVHSITKNDAFSEDDYTRMEQELAPLGITIEREFELLPHDVIDTNWQELMSHMDSSSWDLDRWWEFRYSATTKSERTKEHDVLFVHNVQKKASMQGTDEFGPRVLLLTLDAMHLLRIRRAYPFIIGIRQCQEYFLPYLFLNDMPTKQIVEFPNQLLSAQLGMLLMKYRPKAIDIVESALGSEKPLALL
jgi:hypothetical protein